MKNERGIIQLTDVMAYPPACIWKALTDPTLHAQWWAAGDIRAQQGHRFTLDMGAWGLQPCEVIAVEPEHVFAFSFAIGTLDTTITWRLTPETKSNGTRVSLEHNGFNVDTPQGMAAYEGMRKGWPAVLERLKTVVASTAEGLNF